jgi:hypothetical protein
MTLLISRQRFLQALVMTPAVPLLDAVYIEPRWRGEMSVEFMLSESSYLFTGPGVWSEGTEAEGEESPYEYPKRVYAKLTRAERKLLQLKQDKDGGVRHVGEWENEDLNAFGENLNEPGIPLYLSNEWRWMGGWFST